MPSFLNVLLRNIISGPATDPFPFGETFTPKRIRGRIVIDPSLCLGCGMCRHACAAGAINIRKTTRNWTITIWQGSCCLCRACVTYCPMQAMSIDPNWHSAHLEKDKFMHVEQHTINYQPCANCGQPMRVLPGDRAAELYKHDGNINPEEIRHLCRSCRQLLDAERNTTCALRPERATSNVPS